MRDFDDLLSQLARLLADVEALDEPIRRSVLDLLDGIDELHRVALGRLIGALDDEVVRGLRAREPAAAWLLDAYGIGGDQRAAAEAALASVRPYIHSHGGDVAVLGAEHGVVRVRLSGACSGCTASAITLTSGIEQALREGLPGFTALEVEEDRAAPHPPPGSTLLQIEPFGA